MTAVGFWELAALSRKVSGRPSAAGRFRIGKSARIVAASRVKGRVGAVTAIVSLRGVTLRPPANVAQRSSNRVRFLAERRGGRELARVFGYAGVWLLNSSRPPSLMSPSHYDELTAGSPRAGPTEPVTALRLALCN